MPRPVADTCPVCSGEHFRQSMRFHVRACAKKTPFKRVCCPGCPERVLARDLLEHVAGHEASPVGSLPRGLSVGELSQNERLLNESAEYTGENNEECDVCGRTFAAHRIEKHRGICKTSSASRTRSRSPSPNRYGQSPNRYGGRRSPSPNRYGGRRSPSPNRHGGRRGRSRSPGGGRRRWPLQQQQQYQQPPEEQFGVPFDPPAARLGPELRSQAELLYDPVHRGARPGGGSMHIVKTNATSVGNSMASDVRQMSGW